MSAKSYNRGYVILIATIAAFGGLLFGFDTGVISGALLLIKNDPALIINNLDQLPERTQEWIVSITVLGAAVGALGSGRITDILGRKKVLIITAFIFAIGSVGLGIAGSVAELIIWRLIIGIAIGVASYTVPLYISELSPTHVRGALVSINQLAITVGIFASYLVDLGFANTHEGWRWMFVVGLIPSLVLFVGMFFLPDSPRWLMTYKGEEKARKVLDKVGESNKEEVINQIKNNIKAESKERGSLSILKAKWVRPALIIGIGIMLFQQFTGINTVIYYAPTIFEMAGFGADSANAVYDAILPSLPIGAVNVLFTIVSIYLVDRWGRKPLLYLGLAGMVVALVALGVGFTFQDVIGAGSLKWISFTSMIIYTPFFAISLGPIAWLLISEVFPTKIRGLGMSLASMVNWLCNFLIANTFLTLGRVTTGEMPNPAGEGMLVNPGGAFFIYAAVGILGIIFVYSYIPETKGHSLEKIEEHFLAGKHPKKL
ncbi:MAG: sugar porter family MFS transporter [Bacteroidetes bacterium]|jgi:sugar porter (SP) family MFS transporter|nr:sugar porter family MFS transporter [Bacteroidota bacterium]